MMKKLNIALLLLAVVELASATKTSETKERRHLQDNGVSGGYTVTNSPETTTTQQLMVLDGPTHVTCTFGQSEVAPAKVFYEANISIEPYYEPYRSCSQTEIDEIGVYMDNLWDKYVAENDVLGPIDLHRMGSTCRRRRLDELPQEALQQQRRLPVGNICAAKRGFCYSGAGYCSFCRRDNKDDRRRLSQVEDSEPSERKLSSVGTTPVTIQLYTDAYPNEVAWIIKDSSGNRLFSDSSISGDMEKTVYLEGGQTYYFVGKDGYGDGWCCYEGNGYANLVAGTQSQPGDLLLHFNGQFYGSSKSMSFYVPHAAPVKVANDEDEFDVSVVPQLEADFGQYMTYYVESMFGNSKKSCLFQTYPTVSVGLVATTEEPTASSC